MKRQGICVILILLIGVIVGQPVLAAAVRPARGKALVIYEQDRSATEEQQIGEVIRQVLYAGFDCDAVSQNSYTQGTMNAYSYVVVVGMTGKTFSPNVLSDLAGFRGQLGWIGPGLHQLPAMMSIQMSVTDTNTLQYLFDGVWKTIGLDHTSSIEAYPARTGSVPSGTLTDAANDQNVYSFSNGSLHYFGLVDGLEENEMLQMALQYFLASFFGSQTVDSALYFNLDYIYPVSDFDTISQMGTYLKAKGIPFTFTIMPFYTNATTSEAGVYGKLLRFLQDCGGMPILHIPVYQPLSANASPTYQAFMTYLQTALKNYKSLGVYPAAIELPEDTLFYADCTRFLTQTSDVFTVQGDGKDAHTMSSSTIDASLTSTLTSYSSGASVARELRVPDDSNSFDSFYHTASFLSNDQYGSWWVSCPTTLSFAKFQTLVNGMSSHQIGFDNFMAGTHTVNIGDSTITQTDGAVTYNGTMVPYTPSSSGSKKVSSSPSTRTATFKPNNLIFILPSLSFIAILIVAIWINWQKNKQKFIKRR